MNRDISPEWHSDLSAIPYVTRAAQDVLLLKDDVRELADRFFDRHAKRLRADDPKYLQKVRLLMTFIEQLRHTYTLAKRIAKTQLPIEVAREAA